MLSLVLYLALLPKQQCITVTVHSHEVKRCFAWESWLLQYHCDGGKSDTCDTGDGAYRPFHSKQEAIDWLEANYQFSPDEIMHAGEHYDCRAAYLYPEDDDQDRRKMKSVQCDDSAFISDGVTY